MSPLFVNYGGGNNSTAMLLEAMSRGLPAPAAIFFADTGGEKPATYALIPLMSALLIEHGYPPITVVRWIRKRGPHAGQFVSLEAQSLERKELPSLAYGFKGCSVKWKAQPVDRAVLDHPAYAAPAERWIGYDADEPHRWDRSKDEDRWTWRAPLVEWGWGTEECRERIARSPLAGKVGKSACFFCPAMKAHEIIALKQTHPDLLDRALEIEANAVSTSPGRGLGGSNRRWADILRADRTQLKLFDLMASEAPCGCFDGDN